MKKTIKYFCELCQKDILCDIFNLAKEIEPGEVLKATEMAKHYHWCNEHLVCAICGKRIKTDIEPQGSELTLAINNGSIRVHDNYTDEYRKVKVGEPFWLNVHKKCINDKVEGAI